MTESSSGGWGWKVDTIVKAARWLQLFPGGKRLVVSVRDRAVWGLAEPLHLNAIHTVRRLAAEMTEAGEENVERAPNLAIDFCTECRSVMGRLLHLNANELHCCWKVILPDLADDESELVATWARSRPADNRPIGTELMDAHAVSKNTVWSSLYGRYDGRVNWQPFPCFGCPDLRKREKAFKCDRENWPNYYRSTLVFPLRFATNEQDTEFTFVGFLAFDSPKSGAFGRMPDIFEYQDSPTEYHDKARETAVFHLGAILADTLSLALRSYYEPRILKKNKEA